MGLVWGQSQRAALPAGAWWALEGEQEGGAGASAWAPGPGDVSTSEVGSGELA